MSTLTIDEAVTTFGVKVDDHHDLNALVPVLDGLQFQGDVAVIPTTSRTAKTPLPKGGVPVVRGEAGGNTHLLLGTGDVRFDSLDTGLATDLTLGVLTVGAGSEAYLAHPEHAYSGIAPGSYEIRRQREQADAIRLVTD